MARRWVERLLLIIFLLNDHNPARRESNSAARARKRRAWKAMIELIDNSAHEEPYQAIGTSGFKLVFHWVEDRWAHAILVGEAPETHLAVRSIEGGVIGYDAREIAEPVYQEVNIGRDGDAAVALLIGQSGRHHFSATFRLVEMGTNISVHADIADRQTRPLPEPRPLACTYVVESPPNCIEESSHKFVRWSCSHPAGRLVIAAADSMPTSTIVLTDDAGPDACLVRPIARFDLEATTQRSRFTWTWEPD